jgi:hypothetical protein
VVVSKQAAWLIEKAETSPAHVPTFEEAKNAIRPRALRDAKADAFKAAVEAVAKKGAAAVEAVKGISTNIVFSVADLRQGESSFDNALYVARASMKLGKGEVSDFTLLSPGKAILVVCKDRVPGDAAKAIVLRAQIRDELAMLPMRHVAGEWRKWNLDRLGFEPGEMSYVDSAEEEEE